MRTLGMLIGLIALIGLVPWRASATDVYTVVPKLKEGGYVLVLRHGATDNSQQDVYPFAFDDMRKQRQLSDEGRKVARDIGAAFEVLGISIGQVYSSKLNRAIETAQLVAGVPVITVSDLTDSGVGKASSMSSPNGGSTKIGNAFHARVNQVPAFGTNTLLVTHKTNIADAFGKSFANVVEAETLVFRPNPDGTPIYIGRVKAGEWTLMAGDE